MSLYNPSTIGVASLDVIRTPYVGGEWEVYLSHTAAKHLGKITMTAEDTATYADDAATALAAAGENIQVVCRTPLTSDAACVITFAGMDNSGTPVAMNGVATFDVPAWVEDQSFNFPRGAAVDLVPATEGQMFTAITGLSSVTNGAANVEFDLYTLPALTDYVAIGCTGNIDFGLKSRMALGIDCGLETDAFVKRGKTTPGNLTMDAKYKGLVAGMSRFAGRKVTAMLVGVKDGELTGERLVFTGFVPGVNLNLPEGDGVAMERIEGKFEEVMIFSAPYDAELVPEVPGEGALAQSDDGAGGGAFLEADDGSGGGVVLEFDN